jgi:hypothetical protein
VRAVHCRRCAAQFSGETADRVRLHLIECAAVAALVVPFTGRGVKIRDGLRIPPASRAAAIRSGSAEVGAHHAEGSVSIPSRVARACHAMQKSAARPRVQA